MCSQQIINKWHNGDHAYHKSLIILVLSNNSITVVIFHCWDFDTINSLGFPVTSGAQTVSLFWPGLIYITKYCWKPRSHCSCPPSRCLDIGAAQSLKNRGTAVCCCHSDAIVASKLKKQTKQSTSLSERSPGQQPIKQLGFVAEGAIPPIYWFILRWMGGRGDLTVRAAVLTAEEKKKKCPSTC